MQGWTWTSQMEIVSLLVFHGKTTNPLVMNWTFRPFWKAICENNELRTKENMALWPRPCVSVPIFWAGENILPADLFQKRLLCSDFFWHESKGIEGWFKSDGTVVTIVLNLWKAYLFGASVLRVWFFPAKNSLNKHLETGKLQGVPGWWQWQFEGYQDGERALGEDWRPDASLGQEKHSCRIAYK